LEIYKKVEDLLRDVEVYLVLLQLALSCPELFELVVNDTGKACGFIVAVLHFFSPPPTLSQPP